MPSKLKTTTSESECDCYFETIYCICNILCSFIAGNEGEWVHFPNQHEQSTCKNSLFFSVVACRAEIWSKSFIRFFFYHPLYIHIYYIPGNNGFAFISILCYWGCQQCNWHCLHFLFLSLATMGWTYFHFMSLRLATIDLAIIIIINNQLTKILQDFEKENNMNHYLGILSSSNLSVCQDLVKSWEQSF